MKAHGANEVAGRHVACNEGHGARVVELRETGDEGVRELLHGMEEAEPEVFAADAGEKRGNGRLVFGAHRTHRYLPIARELELTFPFGGGTPDREPRPAHKKFFRHLYRP